ncbi:MAG: ATP-binding cassette domain-containing protein [Alphaproteobacteria bacterium]
MHEVAPGQRGHEREAPHDAAPAGREKRERAVHVGYVLQQGGLLPFLTLRQNMRLAQRVGGRGDDARIAELARRLGIDALLDRKPATLSVGQRQRARSPMARRSCSPTSPPPRSIRPSPTPCSRCSSSRCAPPTPRW